MNSNDPGLSNIFFISLPDTLKTRMSGFSVDPSILLPVEIPPGEENFRFTNLSWEMIIAGMLKLLARDPGHKHADYYRRFVLAVKPDILGHLEDAGLIKVRNKEYELAEEIFKALLGLSPREIAYSINLALLSEERSGVYAELSKKDLEEHYLSQAFDYYKQALNMAPENPDACYHAGYFFLKNGNIEKADEYFRKFIAVSDNDKKTGEIRELLPQLSSRIRMDGLFKEAFDFIQLGKEREAIEKISAFIDGNPHYANAWFLLGWAHRRLKQYDKGRDAFLTALELGSPHADTLNELSICFMELGDFEGCRRRLTEALKLEPENTKILSNLAILSLKEHKDLEAVEIFNKVLDLDPDDAIAVQYLSFLHGGT